jgi:ketopantoate reductase
MKVAVLGNSTMGRAVAAMLASLGHQVTLDAVIHLGRSKQELSTAAMT